MELEPQLLQVWNPLIEPLTVKVHLDALLAQPRDPWVWWGRVYRGKQQGALDPAGARAKWPQVAALADDLDRTGRELVVLTTNFQSLHACRVDRIAFGDAAGRAEGKRCPEYVRGQKVAIWFRVRDVRPLSHDQRATLQWLAMHTQVVPADGVGDFGEFSFDPYAAYHWRYPIVVRSLPTAHLFDPAALPEDGPPGRRLFAAQPGAAFPPDLEAAIEVLRRELEPPWGALDEKTRMFLASARLVEALHDETRARRYAMEPSAAMMLVAKAVETECRAALEAVAALARRRRVALPAPLADAHRVTLGELARLLPDLREAGAALHLPTLSNLAANVEVHRWLEDFVDVRNRAAHAERLALAEFARQRDAVYAKHSSRLTPFAYLKHQAAEAS